MLAVSRYTQMMTRVLMTIIVLTPIACNQKSERNAETTDCKPYFTFDSVEYYSIVIREDSVFNLEKKERKSRDEERLIELLIQDSPNKLSDTIKFLNMETLGFNKKVIQKDKFDQLDKIFCERKHEDPLYTTCIAVYRDILVFKRNKETIGFVRLCFDCGDSIFAGTDLNTLEFGQSGDFQKLGRLLNY
jgi:hypothetical protein